jgi:acetyltransferase-like isoleucine patch superfamily enzyme
MVGTISRVIGLLKDNLLIARDPVAYARSVGVQIGEDCRLIGIKRAQFGSEPYLISIGNHVTITSGVSFTTHDGGVWVLRPKYPDIDVFGRISIEDNVFVGMNATILPGVTIGRNSVIGAGALVNRDVPAGSVVGGVPARHIRTVEEYEQRALAKAVHVRGLPPHEKQAAILAHLD